MQSTEKPPQLLPFWVFDLLSTAVGWRIDPSLVAPCESVCECAVCVLSEHCCVCAVTVLLCVCCIASSSVTWQLWAQRPRQAGAFPRQMYWARGTGLAEGLFWQDRLSWRTIHLYHTLTTGDGGLLKICKKNSSHPSIHRRGFSRWQYCICNKLRKIKNKWSFEQSLAHSQD